MFQIWFGSWYVDWFGNDAAGGNALAASVSASSVVVANLSGLAGRDSSLNGYGAISATLTASETPQILPMPSYGGGGRIAIRPRHIEIGYDDYELQKENAKAIALIIIEHSRCV